MSIVNIYWDWNGLLRGECRGEASCDINRTHICHPEDDWWPALPLTRSQWMVSSGSGEEQCRLQEPGIISCCLDYRYLNSSAGWGKGTQQRKWEAGFSSPLSEEFNITKRAFSFSFEVPMGHAWPLSISVVNPSRRKGLLSQKEGSGGEHSGSKERAFTFDHKYMEAVKDTEGILVLLWSLKIFFSENVQCGHECS